MNWMQLLMQLLPVLSQQGGAARGAPGGGSGGNFNLAAILPLLLNSISSLGAASYGDKQIGQGDNIYNQQQTATNLAMNPLMLARRAAMATQPINKELAYSVTSAADAATAGNGLAQAPGAVAAGRAAALAPYAQQNLQMGADFSEFGLPYAFKRQPEDYLGILNQLNQFGQNSTFSLPAGMMP